MQYKYYCSNCDRNVYIDIPMSEYNQRKDGNLCPDCKGPIRRVIEWSGVASGSGEGWFGKSNGCSAI